MQQKWIVVDHDGDILCERCSDFKMLDIFQMPLSKFIKIAEAFAKQHSKCKVAK